MEESGGTIVMVPLTESVLCARYIGGKGRTVGGNWHRILQQPLDARGKAVQQKRHIAFAPTQLV
jgi:hypothetical protein